MKKLIIKLVITMLNSSFIVSSSGLRNIVLSKKCQSASENDDFRFICGQKEVKMNRIFAEFISPRVSHFHSVDPTLKSINLDEFDMKGFQNEKSNEKGVFFTDEMVDIFMRLSTGYEIEINEKLSHKIRLLAIMLGNEEIYKKINNIYPDYINENNIDSCIQYLQCFYKVPNSFEDDRIIQFIASHFHSIDQLKLLSLPKCVLYSIISSEKLKIENEDSIYLFIKQAFNNINDTCNDKNIYDDDISIMQFYELIDFSSLSQKNFYDFIDNFDPTLMSTFLWNRLKKCFYLTFGKIRSVSTENLPIRYSPKIITLPYNENNSNGFDGIIHYYTNKCGGNVHDLRIIDITSTPLNSYSQLPKYAADLDNVKSYFCSANIRDSWLCYDFRDRKVKPTYYSIRSTRDYAKGYHHLKNWCIEGSNDNKDWKILDARNDETSLDDRSASNTFKIQSSLGENEYYRYLRIRETGANTYGQYNLIFSALEYFGNVKEPSENP